MIFDLQKTFRDQLKGSWNIQGLAVFFYLSDRNFFLDFEMATWYFIIMNDLWLTKEKINIKTKLKIQIDID